MTVTLPPEPAPVVSELSRADRRRLSEGARAEQRLGWKLCAPAVIVMLAVAAFPMGYAIYLSLERYDLHFPNAAKFIGFSNYGTVLTNVFWWRAFLITVIITVVSVIIEFVIGMAFALVMHRTPLGRGLVRTFILIPYGLVTVVAAYGWAYAWTPGTGYLANLLPKGSAPLTHTFQATLIIILAEVWKTTPFMALLLLSGLSLVSDDLLQAARVDGASAWQRFTRITLPLMKPAILVALLFRTLDAFRIFDNIYILTGGQDNTGSVSFLAYDNLFNGLNLGIGSTISVLIFITVGILAFVFIKLFGTSAPGIGPGLMATTTLTRGRRAGWAGGDILVLLWVLFPLWWIVALSFKTPSAINNGDFWPTGWTTNNYSTIFKNSDFLYALRNSLVVAVISTVIAVVLGSFAAYAISRLRFAGKKVLVGASLMVAMFPQISLVTPLFNVERSIHLFDTWWGLVIPYVAFSLPLAIYTLSAFFREIPRDLERAAQVDGATPTQAFVRVIAPLAMPGVVTSSILVFLFCWNDFLFAISLTSTKHSQTVPAAIAFFTGNSSFENPIGNIAAAAVIISIPILIFVLFFQRRIVAGLTSGAVKG